jgi:hypothetical protein
MISVIPGAPIPTGPGSHTMVVTSPTPEMQNTVRHEITQDTRASQLSPTQVNEITELLAQKATAQGLQPADVSYRPEVVLPPVVSSPLPESTAISINPLVPLGLGVGLLLIVALVIVLIRKRRQI